MVVSIPALMIIAWRASPILDRSVVIMASTPHPSTGFCPVPHTFRDQVWLGVGAAIGLTIGYKLATSRPVKTGIAGLHLKYWAGRGLMEIPRQMLAIAGVFPPMYIDGRYTTDEPKNGSRPFSEVANTLASNLGRMPVASLRGADIGQSNAINYFIAAELDMLGDTTIETAQILSIQEHLTEMRQAVQKVEIDQAAGPTAAQLEKLFGPTALDRSPAPADGEHRKERFYQWFLARIEYVCGDNGFAVGNRLSLADVLLHNYLAETLPDAQCGREIPKWRREPLMSQKMTSELLKHCPKINKILANVRAQKGLQKWLEVRGKQMF